MGDKGDKSAARPPEGSLVETWCLIKGPKSAIVPFAEPRTGPKSRTDSGVLPSNLKYSNYLSLPPTRHDLTQGQKPEGRLKWGKRGGEGRERAETQTLLDYAAHRLT